MRRFLPILALAAIAFQLVSREPAADPRLKGAHRKPEVNGWVFVRLEGSPAEIGFQHGWLLAREIEDLHKVTVLNSTHDSNKDWPFFRNVAEKILWPRIEQEYRDELQGITDGIRARGSKLDLWDVVAVNASIELGYYVCWYDKQRGAKPPPSATVPDRCSAFVATGR